MLFIALKWKLDAVCGMSYQTTLFGYPGSVEVDNFALYPAVILTISHVWHIEILLKDN